MNNISSLFENLMTYSENNEKSSLSNITESDQTVINLAVEIPKDADEITPEDINVEVGVMELANEDSEKDETANEAEEDETVDVTPEDEGADETNKEAEEEPQKEESLEMRKEVIRRRRRDMKTACENKECADNEECIEEKEESSSVETAKANIRKRVAASECSEASVKTEGKNEDNVKVKDLKVGTKVYMEIPGDSKNPVKTVKELPAGGGIIFTDGSHADLDKNQFVKLYKESLLHLDTKSLNKLFTEFVRENYKNIDKVVITKSMLENNCLTIRGYISDLQGKKESVTFMNRGFNAEKLENTRFLIDFKDMSETFGVIKESLKQPFVFTATLKENKLTFEELKYSFKTMHESKVAKVFGKCTLNESIEIKTESSDQLNKFYEIVEKIKAAKTFDELTDCKDLMDNSNIGDTLLSAAQMVWDDVASKFKR